MTNQQWVEQNRERWNEYQRERYREHRDWAIEFLGGECFECGDTENLQFVNPNGTGKQEAVSTIIRGWSKDRLAEFFKARGVELLCVSCRRR